MKVRVITYFYFFSLLILSYTGCVDSIDFDVPGETRNSIFIFSRLVISEPSYVEVDVSRIFDFTTGSRLNIQVEKVTLENESGQNKSLTNTSRDDFYEELDHNDPNLPLEIGKKYRILVELFDGSLYFSEYETLLETPDPIEMSTNITPMRGDTVFLVNFFVHSQLRIKGVKARGLRWELEKVWLNTDDPPPSPFEPDTFIRPRKCYLNQLVDQDRVILFDGRTISGDVLDGFSVYETRTDVEFAEGYYLNARQEVLSETATEFWSQVHFLSNKNGNLADPPAGKLISNYTASEDSNFEVYGIFYATQPKMVRKYVSPDEVGNPRLRCPPIFTKKTSNNQYCPTTIFCCDCRDLANSTIIKPDWWVK